MTDIHDPFLSDGEVEAFREEGYVRLGQVVPVEEIEALCERIDDIMLGNIAYPDMLMQLCPSAGDEEKARQTKGFKGSSLKYRKIEDLEKDPLFRAYIRHPLFRNATAKIIGEKISIYRAMFFNKPAEQGVTIDWHQDGAAGWRHSIPPRITMWTALDATCVANGCLQIIPGSHKSSIPEKGDRLSAAEIAVHAPDEKRLFLELERGEVVLLHNWTLHRSETNHTDRPRRAFSVWYMDAATTSIWPDSREKDSGESFVRVFPDYEPVGDREEAMP